MILLDTHVLLWTLKDDPRLGTKARRLIDEAVEEGGVWISAITLWEISMLASKGRIRLEKSVSAWIKTALEVDGISLAPVEPEIAVDAGQLVGLHGDPSDRLIIATARARALPLMTADRLILAYAAEGHVQAIDAHR